MARQFHLADLFETAAATVGDRAAIKSDAGHLTYAELNDRADRVAAGLMNLGVVRGDHVGLYMMNGPAFIESFLAIIKIGAVPFNINYRYRADELRTLFGNARAKAIIHDAEFSDTVAAIRGDLSDLALTIAVEDGIGVAHSPTYADLLATPPATKPYPRDEQDIILLYTGGTTGLPKGVMWTHRDFFFGCLNGAGYYHPEGPCKEPADIAKRAGGGYPLTMFPLAPLMHGAAIWATLGGLLSGLTVVLDPLRNFDAEAIWDRVEREGANMVQIVGDAMAIPLRDALRANPDRWSLGHVVNVGSGGAVFSDAIKADIKQLIPSAMITDGMGSSETGVAGMAMPSPDGMMRLPVTDIQTIIIDGRLGQMGETGFVSRSGPVPIGYYGDPDMTAATFITIDDQRWAITGDTARIDNDGMMTIFGRGATCINSGGEKIFPEEVEAALRGHPAVFDAVAVGQPDDRWGERVFAIVSSRSGAQRPSLEELRQFLSEKLAGYKLPKAVMWVDAVQRSPAGKQDYRWARDMATKAARDNAACDDSASDRGATG